MDKSKHLIGFYKIVWVPSKTRDQKNDKKYLKNTNISILKCLKPNDGHVFTTIVSILKQGLNSSALQI